MLITTAKTTVAKFNAESNLFHLQVVCRKTPAAQQRLPFRHLRSSAFEWAFLVSFELS